LLIQILNIQIATATTKAGKPYDVLDIAFKNKTFQDKVEGKKLMPFGGNAPAFAVLKNANSGQLYEIQVVKNDAGYNDWVNATVSDGASVPPQQGNAGPARANQSAPAAGNSRGFETPEERAAKQVFIVRQSSLSTAVASLSVGSKSALKPSDVIEAAKEYEAFVFGNPAPQEDLTGFDDMSDDVPL
jgi:hypothetical protein